MQWFTEWRQALQTVLLSYSLHFCSTFVLLFFGATLTDLTLASKRPMRSMGPTGAQLFCIESTIPGRTCWYHCWAMAVELGAPLLRETAVIPGFAHYMRLYSLLAKPLFFTHDHKSMLRSNVWCIWCNWWRVHGLIKVSTRIVTIQRRCVHVIIYIVCTVYVAIEVR